MKFKITNGLLFDPIQNFDKKKKDIFVDGNKIVDPSSEEKKKYILLMVIKSSIQVPKKKKSILLHMM